MSLLQSLRQARSIVRWMVVSFVLSMGVAVAAPVLHPQALTLVCTTAGSVKFVAESGDSADSLPAAMQAHALDCVLCLPAGAPPSTPAAQPVPMAARTVQPAAPPAQLITRLVNTAPARGPPARL